MATLGSLVVTLEANVAKFQSDLGRAVTMAESSMNQISAAVGKVSEAFGLLGIAIGVSELAHFGLETIEATAHLQALSLATGASVESLSAIKNTAAGVGVGIDEAAGAFERMEKQAGLATEGNKKALAAFHAIGIEADALKTGLKDPQALLLAVAQALEQFTNDGNKTTVMMQLLGRGGANAAVLLHELATAGYANSTVTTEQALRTEEFEKALASLKVTMQSLALSVFGVIHDVVPNFILLNDTIEQGFELMWINITSSFKISAAWLKGQIADMAGEMGKLLLLLPKNTLANDLGKKMRDYADESGTGEWANNGVAAAQADRQRRLADNAKAQQDSADAFVKATHPAIEPAVAPKPSISLPDVENKDLKKLLDSRLKMIQEEIKFEDEANKTANGMLDADYKSGIVSLASYSMDKNNLLATNLAYVASLYDQEIALATKFAASRTNQTDKDMANAKVQELINTKSGAEAAGDTVRIANQAKLISDSDKYAHSLIALSVAYENLNGNTAKAETMQAGLADAGLKTTLIANQNADALEKLAAIEARRNQLAIIAQDKPVLDTAMAYALLTGNTEAATLMQIKQNDEVLRYTLTVQHATTALAQLDALEKEQMLRASRDPFSGIQRSVQDYIKGLQNVAAQTEAMTTKMLKGMEDALVNFVMTGKLNFRSLITSMIADLVRLAIQQNLVKIFSLVAGGAGAAAGGGSAIASTLTSAQTAGMAVGGAVNQGQQYTVGERGPEQFVPSVAGSIMPNGSSGGGTSITYAPTIQIDSRSDRAQVQSDTASIMRQGQKELLGLLQRYNPGLRA